MIKISSYYGMERENRLLYPATSLSSTDYDSELKAKLVATGTREPVEAAPEDSV